VRTDEELRATLRAVIEDIDSGRLCVPRPAPWGARLGAPLVAAALGLGLAACTSTEQPAAGTTSEPTVAPTLGPVGTAPVTNEPVAPPNTEYMAPGPRPIAPGSGAGTSQLDPGQHPTALPTPMYAVRPPPTPRTTVDPPARPAYGVPPPTAPNPRPRPLYAVD
jgi:hypothetical protein